MTALQHAIHAEYQVREAAAGGLGRCDPQQIADDIADEWELPVRIVKEAIEAAQAASMGER